MPHAHTLSSYLRAILHLQNEPVLQDHIKAQAVVRQEAGYTIESISHHYHFANGVIIACEVEQEWEDGSLQEGKVCPPCDISYRVVNAQGLDILPRQKSFKNSCQMHFWIQAHHLPVVNGEK